MAQVLINGTQYSWGQIQIVMLGSAVAGVTKIDYERTLKADSLYGAGQEPIGYGYGNYTYTASIEMYMEEWRKISLAAGGDALVIPPFNISILFLQDANGIIFPYKDILFNCQFLKDGLTSTQGDTNLKVTIPLMISGFSRFN